MKIKEIQKMPSYREGQAIVCDEVVAYLGQFHQKRCRPNEGECACWTEIQQKHFQAKARNLREYDAALRASRSTRKGGPRK